jgi:hypothetical protein
MIMPLSLLLRCAVAYCLAYSLTDCTGSTQPQAEEFVVQSHSLQGYTQWLRATEISGTGNFPLLLGRAHYASSPWVTRRVYVNTLARQGRTQGEFSIGSIIVKTFHDNTGKWLLGEAMVKRQARGGIFNPDHQGWEWLEIKEDGTIARDSAGREQRGAQFYGNQCNVCHAQYRANDYVFTY